MEDEDNKKGNISNILKKVVNTGIGAAFLTEDAVKGIIEDLPIPKDMVNGLLQNAKASKDEFVASVKSELKTYLKGIDLTKEIEKVLENYDLEVNAKINFKKKEETEVTQKVVKKTAKKPKDE